MRFSTSAAVAFLMSGMTSVLAETFTVTVGKDASLLFEPTSVNAKVGDVVAFQFMSKNHTVTQSTFDKPCEPKAGGVDSGYQFIPGGASLFPQWSITINNDTGPLWFYCAQQPHCARGMVFAVNPTAEKTFDQFKANAAASAPPAASSGAAAGGYGAAGGAPVATTPATTPAASPDTTAAAANAGAAPGGTAESLNNGALSRVSSAAGWPILLGSVVMGALVL